MYIDYSDYAAKGGSADNVAFSRLCFRAEKLIDLYTQSRIRDMQSIPEAVQYCMVELINAMAAADIVNTSLKPVVTSFSNDGYSESYSDSATPEKLQSFLTETIYTYLSGECDDDKTPLLFRGVTT